MRLKRRSDGTLILPPFKCPNCGYVMDAAKVLDREEEVTPRPGGFSVCIGCGDMNRFGDDLQVRAVTTDELIELPLDQREYLLWVEERTKAFLRAKGRTRNCTTAPPAASAPKRQKAGGDQ